MNTCFHGVRVLVEAQSLRLAWYLTPNWNCNKKKSVFVRYYFSMITYRRSSGAAFRFNFWHLIFRLYQGYTSFFHHYPLLPASFFIDFCSSLSNFICFSIKITVTKTMSQYYFETSIAFISSYHFTVNVSFKWVKTCHLRIVCVNSCPKCFSSGTFQ